MTADNQAGPPDTTEVAAVVVAVAKKKATHWTLVTIGPWVLALAFIITLAGSVLAMTGNLPSTLDLGPGPFAQKLIPQRMLVFYQSGIVKRECLSLNWSIVAAMTHAESSDGQNLAGNFGNAPNPIDPANGPTSQIRLGPDQLTLSMWDTVGHQAVVEFRVKPDITPDGVPKAPNFNNPNNPWDTGYAGATSSDKAQWYGWSGDGVSTWDYNTGSPLYYVDKRTRQRRTDYKYDASTHGPLGNRIPFYRVADGKGYAVDGNGDGNADIMNPEDSAPALARYLCGHGAADLSTLYNAVYDFRPTWWYVLGGYTGAGKEFRGILPLAKQLTVGGSPIRTPQSVQPFPQGVASPPDTNPGALPGSRVEAAITWARSVIGTPYVWGGEEIGGFDCSGLVWWAYSQAGFPFGRTTAAGEWNWGPHVTASQLQRGDLVFWAYNTSDPSTIHHVAIYLGNGQIIVAPHTGAVVGIQPMYYSGFIGGVRITG